MPDVDACSSTCSSSMLATSSPSRSLSSMAPIPTAVSSSSTTRPLHLVIRRPHGQHQPSLASPPRLVDGPTVDKRLGTASSSASRAVATSLLSPFPASTSGLPSPIAAIAEDVDAEDIDDGISGCSGYGADRDGSSSAQATDQEDSIMSNDSVFTSTSSSASTSTLSAPGHHHHNHSNQVAVVAPAAVNPNPTMEEMQILAKMEELNRQLEADAKSLNSLSGTSGHSRKSSDTSQISINSATSQYSNTAEEDPEDTWQLWGRVVAEWDLYSKKKTSYVRDLVRKGIPHHFRGLAWQLLCSAHSSPEKDKYAEYIKNVSPCEKVIRRDIARTYPEHEFFKEKDGPGQESLFNVMKAYSLHDREVGYCQGSAFIVGLLLMQMPEEEAFAVLVKIMQDYKMREMFKPSMAELGLCIYQLECLVQELLPELHVHFQSQGLHTSMYASSWFLTLFSTSLMLPLAFRVMDVFISEGMEMIFRIAISILQTCKEELLSQDMEGMIKFLQKDMPVFYDADPELLMNVAYLVKYNAKKMKRLEKEYTTKRTKEQEEMIEIRRLRTENRLLRQRIDNLEQESSSLADRLIQGQVTRAQEAEETFALKRELGAVKQQNQELLQTMEGSNERIKLLEIKAAERGSEDAEDLITVLQDELVNIRLREAESDVTMKEMKVKLHDMEEANKKLRDTPPDNNVAHLQEELISLKLRDAESSLSMKDLSQRIEDLSLLWEKHLKENHQGENGKRKEYSKNTMAQLHEDLLTAKLNEAKAVSALKESNHRIMELESQNQIYLNQIRRQEEEIRKLEDKVEDGVSRERSLTYGVQDEKRKMTELESTMKEQLMMSRIREMEKAQSVAELEQKLSSMECKHEELLTARQLSRGYNDDAREMQDRIADSQAEIHRLEAINRKLTAALANHNSIPISHRNGNLH